MQDELGTCFGVAWKNRCESQVLCIAVFNEFSTETMSGLVKNELLALAPLHEEPPGSLGLGIWWKTWNLGGKSRPGLAPPAHISQIQEAWIFPCHLANCKTLPLRLRPETSCWFTNTMELLLCALEILRFLGSETLNLLSSCILLCRLTQNIPEAFSESIPFSWSIDFDASIGLEKEISGRVWQTPSTAGVLCAGALVATGTDYFKGSRMCLSWNQLKRCKAGDPMAFQSCIGAFVSRQCGGTYRFANYDIGIWPNSIDSTVHET